MMTFRDLFGTFQAVTTARDDSLLAGRGETLVLDLILSDVPDRWDLLGVFIGLSVSEQPLVDLFAHVVYCFLVPTRAVRHHGCGKKVAPGPVTGSPGDSCGFRRVTFTITGAGSV